MGPQSLRSILLSLFCLLSTIGCGTPKEYDEARHTTHSYNDVGELISSTECVDTNMNGIWNHCTETTYDKTKNLIYREYQSDNNGDGTWDTSEYTIYDAQWNILESNQD